MEVTITRLLGNLSETLYFDLKELVYIVFISAEMKAIHCMSVL